MTFSIGWPAGFHSRTTDPTDPCFVGKVGANARQAHEPCKASQAPWADKAKKPAMQAQRLRVGTHAWRVVDLLRRTGPLPRSAIACTLLINARSLDFATQGLVQAGVLDKKTPKNKQSTYSIGKTPVVEVQR